MIGKLNRERLVKSITPGINALVGLAVQEAKDKFIEEAVAQYREELVQRVDAEVQKCYPTIRSGVNYEETMEGTQINIVVQIVKANEVDGSIV